MTVKKGPSDDNIEKLLQSVVRSEMSNVTPPPPDDLWIRIQKKAELPLGAAPTPRRTVVRRTIIGVVAAVASVLLVLEIGAPDGANAIGQRLVRTFEQISGSVARILQSSDRREPRDDTSPPPNTAPNTAPNRRPVSLSEAKEKLPFPLRLPDYLPAGYALDEVILLDRGEGDADAILRYAGDDGEINLTEVFFPDGWAAGSVYDVEDTVMREVDLGTAKGQLLVFKTGESRLTWIEGSVFFTLSGRVQPDELILIAQSLK